MDRQITKEEKDLARRKKLIKGGIIGGCVLVVGIIVTSLMRTSVSREDLTVSEVSRGTIEVSVTASGKVSPAIEEIINSPITTRILEAYKRGGDSVDVGTPILKLDLQSAETDFGKLSDEQHMKALQLEQLRVNNETFLSDLAMKVEVEEMRLGSMEVNLRNEKRLDSLGSGTTDKVRQAELEYNTARLELQQLRQQLANERRVKEADLKVKELELNISIKSMYEMRRTLEDAQIRSPRKGILTYINSQVGAQVGQGNQVAIVSDLSHFKVDAEIADSYGDRVVPGGKTIVKVGSKRLEGVVSSVTPLSRNGVINFTVQLNEDNDENLRSGLNTDVYVTNSIKDDVLRIASGSYYQGPNNYELFVFNGDDELVKRDVRLGESSFEYVVVLSGLKEGDRVVTSSMNSYRGKNSLKVN